MPVIRKGTTAEFGVNKQENGAFLVDSISYNVQTASVDQTGRVTGVAMGATVITATTASGKTASCQVTVTAATVKNVTVSISLSSSGDLIASKSYTATLQFSPALSASDTADFLYAIDSDALNVVTATNDYVTNSFIVVAGDDGSATLTPYIYTEKKNINFTFVPLTVTVNSPSSDIKNPVTAISLTIASGSSNLYVGDTMGDYNSAREAGVDFIYAKYGFGDVPDAPETIFKPRDLIRIYEESERN